MSATVRHNCPCGEDCYRNEGLARQALDTTRQRQRQAHAPWWTVPNRVQRARCGRWHLRYSPAAREHIRAVKLLRQQLPPELATLTAAA